MIDIIKVIVLGIVEGITEFLPISSTGHLIVATALLNPGFSAKDTFDIFIQVGAVVAVIAFYRADLWHQIKSVRTDRAVQHFWVTMVIAFIPAAVVGLATRHFIKSHLFSPVVVAISLIIGGVLFIVLEWFLRDRNSSTTDMMNVTYRQAVVIGVVQTAALIPGVSRAAASIFGGMMSGLDRETATKFSFYLAIPTLGAATVVDLLLSLKDVHGSDLAYMALGAVVSGIVAWVAIGWLLRYISHNTFIPFGYYRIAAGIVILVLMAAAIL